MAQGAGGITFGAAKSELAHVSHNGICVGDSRVLARTNEAIKVLLDEVIPVGGMATYDVVANGTVLLLPKQLENAIEVEVLNNGMVNFQRDVTQGWYDLVSNFAYVDPATAHDNPLVDMYLAPDPGDSTILRRQYDYPGLQAGATVRVTGAKRYVPIVDDSNYLIVQNVPALKMEILALELLDNNEPEMADRYHKMAVARLMAEVKKHQLDPRNALKRKAAYQKDLIDYLEGTLGRTRARLALEIPGFLLRGKSEITYFVNRAVQMLVDNRNQLAIAGRISVHGTVTELSYVPAVTADTELIWSDYNQIRLMVQSFITEGADPNAAAVAEKYQKDAFELQRAQLIEATEKARHTTYTSALTEYVPGCFGWTVARLALELPNGLAMTTTEIERLVSMAEMRILERGIFKGSLKTLTATITGGEILFPRDVEAVLAADICGMPTDIRSIFFPFQKNGPGYHYEGCQSRFDDQGEIYFTQTGSRRRKYLYKGSCTSSVELKAVCKIRYVPKETCDEMVIKNFEAIKLMSQSLNLEKQEKWAEARVAASDAIDVLTQELNQYLGGVAHVPNYDTDAGYGFSGLGSPM